MDPMAIAGMIFTLVLTVIIGGFILLFPLAKRLGLLIESKIQDKDAARQELASENQLKEMIQGLETQIRALVERQEFTEKLLSHREQQNLLKPRDPNS